MPADQIRLLESRDIPFAQSIRETAGWNQTDRDWERLIRFEPAGCFLIESGGKPAGTATTTNHHGEVAWIGMVLVHPDFRRRGLATRLMRQCIEYLQPRTRCIKLDATPAGMKVYEKLGFVEESRLHRWSGIIQSGNCPSVEWNRAEIPADVDRSAFGAERILYLEELAEDSFWINSVGSGGYGMIRDGIQASYLGPVAAEQADTGAGLVRTLLATKTGQPVFWDIPDRNRAAGQLAGELGFTRQRELIRMRLGPDSFGGDPAMQWSISAPETG